MMHGFNRKIVQELGLAAAVWLGVTAAVNAYPWDGAAWADNSAFLSPITQQVKDRCRAIRATTNGQTRTAGRMGQIGDSITYSSAFFVGPACVAPSPNETGHDYLPIRQWLTGDANPGYGSWYYQANGPEKRGKGAAYGCYTGWEVDDAAAAGHPANCVNVGLNGIPGNYSWALIMYGTNDIDPPGWTPAAWRTAYSNFVQAFIAQGVIPVLSTIPPERAHVGDGRVEQANAEVRALAGAMDIPYVDYYALIKFHQPTAWDGTLIGQDGSHPSADGAGFSRMALTTNNGFAARSKLTLDMAEKLKAIIFDNGPADGAAAGPPAGNWIGYEGALHQSSSPTDIATPLTRLWDQRFTNKVTIPAASGWTTTGNHCARNLTYYQGYLGLVASVANQTKQTANVAILDATNGAVVNCVSCDHEWHGAYKSMYDATETAWGEHVAAWDPDTGILFLAIGGDMPGHTAILPLANRATYSGSVQAAVGAYATLATNNPDLRGSNDQRRDSAIAGNVHDGGALASDEWGEAQNRSCNRTAMFDVQAGSPYLAINRGLGHESATGSSFANKYTGLPAKKPYGDMSNPLDYDSLTTEAGFACFKMWGGILTATNRVYFLGPYESAISPYDTRMSSSSRGLRVACMVMNDTDVRANGGYTGPGAAETAVPQSKYFDFAVDSTTTNNNESWVQAGSYDGYQRNKAWMVQGDGIWAAWKPSRTSAVELVRVTGTESSRYSLGVGTNMLYSDIWPNIAYTDCGAAGRYVVYYAANAYTGWNHVYEFTPAGPATLTVFDADSRTVRWTVELNNAARTGAYPDLRPNPCVLWYETSRLVVAGRYAHLAWVDTVGAGNAQLKVATFDVAGGAPAAAPAPRAFDLGIPKAGNGKSRVTDLIAVSNMLYVLVSEDNIIDRDGSLNAQRVVALQGGTLGATNPTAVIDLTPPSGVAPLPVTCSGSRSSDPDGTLTNYAWTFGDGSAPAAGVSVPHTFATAGAFTVSLTVTDNDGNTDTAQTTLTVSPPSQFQYVTNLVVVTGTNVVGGPETPVQDTVLNVTQPSNDGLRNLGELRAGSYSNATIVPLLSFSLPALSNNAELVSATLRLYCFNISGTPVIAAYPMLKPWSWRYACYNYRDNATWWNGGNQPFDVAPPTEDYQADAGAISGTIALNQHAMWDVTTMVSNWYANPVGNYGLTLIPTAASSDLKFYSSNRADTNVVPALILVTRYAVETNPPTNPPLVELTGLTVAAASNVVVWTNSGGPATAYRVYRSTNLMSGTPTGGWLLMDEVSGASAWVDTNRADAGAAVFYRILAPAP